MADRPDRTRVVLDASAVIEALLGTPRGRRTSALMRASNLHAPAHLDAEVLSALGRMHRAGRVTATRVDTALEDLAAAPIDRHPLSGLLRAAWDRRESHRLADALYVELAEALDTVVLTTDARLARAGAPAELVGDDASDPV